MLSVPPLATNPESLVPAAEADGVVLAVRRRTRVAEVQEAISSVEDNGGSVLGLVLVNK